MPPSLMEWLPKDHLVWTVLGAVEMMDLSRFEDAYRLGAAGSPAYDPQMLVALLFYSYARGIRSSRGIERACFEDVAYRVIAPAEPGSLDDRGVPPPARGSTSRELFDEVLGLCREAGLVSVGVITIDGTKIKANASMDQNRSYREVVTEILREAEEIDRREDELYGEARGDELPEQLHTPEGRRAALGMRSGGSRSARGGRQRGRGGRGTWGGSGAGAWSWRASGRTARVASGRAPRARRAQCRAKRGRWRVIGRTACFRRRSAGGEPSGRPGRQ